MLYRGGLVRAAWMTLLFAGIGFGLVVLVRWSAHWDPIIKLEPLVLVSALVTAPIGFLAGIGAFDYWAYYALGFRGALTSMRSLTRRPGLSASTTTATKLRSWPSRRANTT